MEALRASGLFNLPDSPAAAVRGDFTFDGELSSVELHDSLVEFITPQGQALYYGGEESAEHPVIHGRLDNGELITMLGAYGSRSSPLGRFESWRCSVALLGGHASSDSFDRITMRFDCLRGWAEPPPVIRGNDLETPTLDTSRHVLARATVADAVVTLVAGVEGQWGGNSAQVDRTCNLVVECPPTSFRGACDRLGPLAA